MLWQRADHCPAIKGQALERPRHSTVTQWCALAPNRQTPLAAPTFPAVWTLFYLEKGFLAT